MVIFSEHNVINDPPFDNLDLISFRNLLISMSVDLQNKIIPLLHSALKPGGYLFLGSPETTGKFNDMFTLVDCNSKIYRRMDDIHCVHLLSQSRHPASPNEGGRTQPDFWQKSRSWKTDAARADRTDTPATGSPHRCTCQWPRRHTLSPWPHRNVFGNESRRSCRQQHPADGPRGITGRIDLGPEQGNDVRGSCAPHRLTGKYQWCLHYGQSDHNEGGYRSYSDTRGASLPDLP